ncbi:MAG: M23 family metallopeptidase [Oscillospiraceae bacterium]|nr:M23 family metallopeptidase [Oscillospiraceae bacterium]
MNKYTELMSGIEPAASDEAFVNDVLKKEALCGTEKKANKAKRYGNPVMRQLMPLMLAMVILVGGSAAVGIILSRDNDGAGERFTENMPEEDSAQDTNYALNEEDDNDTYLGSAIDLIGETHYYTEPFVWVRSGYPDKVYTDYAHTVLDVFPDIEFIYTPQKVTVTEYKNNQFYAEKTFATDMITHVGFADIAGDGYPELCFMYVSEFDGVKETHIIVYDLREDKTYRWGGVVTGDDYLIMGTTVGTRGDNFLAGTQDKVKMMVWLCSPTGEIYYDSDKYLTNCELVVIGDELYLEPVADITQEPVDITSLPEAPKFELPIDKNVGVVTEWTEWDGGFRGHSGIDISAPAGTPIMAAADGTVILADWASGYGRAVIIEHENGYKTLYGHCESFADGIAEGQKVERGETIAYVGSTGRADGPHVHLEFRHGGQILNPTDFMDFSTIAIAIPDRNEAVNSSEWEDVPSAQVVNNLSQIASIESSLNAWVDNISVLYKTNSTKITLSVSGSGEYELTFNLVVDGENGDEAIQEFTLSSVNGINSGTFTNLTSAKNYKIRLSSGERSDSDLKITITQ